MALALWRKNVRINSQDFDPKIYRSVFCFFFVLLQKQVNAYVSHFVGKFYVVKHCQLPFYRQSKMLKKRGLPRSSFSRSSLYQFHSLTHSSRSCFLDLLDSCSSSAMRTLSFCINIHFLSNKQIFLAPYTHYKGDQLLVGSNCVKSAKLKHSNINKSDSTLSIITAFWIYQHFRYTHKTKSMKLA